MPLLSIHHVTTYRYRQPVAFGEHRIMFRPHDGHDQRLVSAEIAIDPAPASLRWVHDVFGNCVAIARFAGSSDILSFASDVTVEHRPAPLRVDCDETILAGRASLPFAYDAEDMPDLHRSMERAFPVSLTTVCIVRMGFP